MEPMEEPTTAEFERRAAAVIPLGRAAGAKASTAAAAESTRAEATRAMLDVWVDRKTKKLLRDAREIFVPRLKIPLAGCKLEALPALWMHPVEI